MYLHQPPRLFAFGSTLISRSLSTAFAVLACMPGGAAPQDVSEPAVCATELRVATRKVDDLPASTIRTRVGRGIERAAALFRFHRSEDALAKLDAAVALLDGPRGVALNEGVLTELRKSINALRSCLATTEPAALAMITIGAFTEDGTPEGNPGSPAGEGVYVDVEGIRIGRTGPDGTLPASVPSGTIGIRAAEYPSYQGRAVVTLAAGEVRSVSVVLAEGKEPSEDSDLVLEEAPDGILPAKTTSLTLAFVQEDVPASIESIESIDVSDVVGDTGENLEGFFSVSNGVMHATDLEPVLERIASQSRIGRPLWLSANAIDTEGRFHYGAVAIHLGRFSLAVRLAAPPSNPALPVSNIPVRVSVVGSEIAMRVLSDADGRFEIESLPDATVAFDAEAIASGVYYYGQATLTMCADRSVTLAMLNVKDVTAGTRALILDPGTPPCPPVPRR